MVGSVFSSRVKRNTADSPDFRLKTGDVCPAGGIAVNGDSTKIERRSFLIAGAAIVGTSALSYGRIIGAKNGG